MAGDFLYTDLGQCRRGDVVEVTLTRAANVRLLDSTNYNKYRRGQQHRYSGGLAKTSPVRLPVPRSGHWHVAVDMQGLRGTSRATVRKIPVESLRPLPPIREARPELAEIAHALASRRLAGIVVLSAPFFSKSWPKYELDGLVTMAVSGRQVLLPLWHGISKDEVIKQSPSLADKVALRTADSTIDDIADEIAAVVRDE